MIDSASDSLVLPLSPLPTAELNCLDHDQVFLGWGFSNSRSRMLYLSTVATTLSRLVGAPVPAIVVIHPSSRPYCSAPIAGLERLSPIPRPPARPVQLRPRNADMPRPEAALRVDTRWSHYTRNRLQLGRIGKVAETGGAAAVKIWMSAPRLPASGTSSRTFPRF
jgi:hypothetical protein